MSMVSAPLGTLLRLVEKYTPSMKPANARQQLRTSYEPWNQSQEL